MAIDTVNIVAALWLIKLVEPARVAMMLALASGIASVRCHSRARPCGPAGGLPIAVISGVVGAVAFVLVARLLRMDQLSYLVATLRRH